MSFEGRVGSGRVGSVASVLPTLEVTRVIDVVAEGMHRSGL